MFIESANFFRNDPKMLDKNASPKFQEKYVVYSFCVLKYY